MSTNRLGTLGWARRESLTFVRRFSGWLAVLFIFALPAILLIFAFLPHAAVLLVGATISTAISLTRMAVFEHDEESKLETDPLSSGELYMLVLVMYTMFAGGISAVLLASVAVGLFTLILTESLLLTLAISILFPIFDQKVEKNIGFGVFRATSSVILAFFEMLTEMYRLSHSILDQARYQRRRLIQ